MAETLPQTRQNNGGLPGKVYNADAAKGRGKENLKPIHGWKVGKAACVTAFSQLIGVRIPNDRYSPDFHPADTQPIDFLTGTAGWTRLLAVGKDLAWFYSAPRS